MITAYEEAIKRLSAATGAEIDIGPDRIAMVEVEGDMIMLRPAGEDESGLTAFSILAEGGDDIPLPRSVLELALDMNLFGVNTGGGHIGFINGGLVFSLSRPLEGTTAEAVAEQLVAFTHLSRELKSSLDEAHARGDVKDASAGEVEKALREQTRSAQYGGELDGFYDDVMNKVIFS